MTLVETGILALSEAADFYTLDRAQLGNPLMSYHSQAIGRSSPLRGQKLTWPVPPRSTRRNDFPRETRIRMTGVGVENLPSLRDGGQQHLTWLEWSSNQRGVVMAPARRGRIVARGFAGKRNSPASRAQVQPHDQLLQTSGPCLSGPGIGFSRPKPKGDGR